jgi:hypothetical protein
MSMAYFECIDIKLAIAAIIDPNAAMAAKIIPAKLYH